MTVTKIFESVGTETQYRCFVRSWHRLYRKIVYFSPKFSIHNDTQNSSTFSEIIWQHAATTMPGIIGCARYPQFLTRKDNLSIVSTRKRNYWAANSKRHPVFADTRCNHKITFSPLNILIDSIAKELSN